ncbi:MAG: UDP-2,3-diacylglucosamine diphosphatase LpxI [Rickettsiales bacterium]|nr:UDP-2,3-diacylglucosamine diphosphatase LpxI [Rickettsiales bacterium]
MEAFGIIAGGGEIPHHIVNKLNIEKIPFCVVSINGLFVNAKNLNIDCKRFEIGQVSGILNFLNSNNVKKVCFVGRVSKPNFSDVKIDLKGSALLAKIGKNKLLGDDNILRTVIDYIEKHEIKVVSALDICNDLTMSSKGYYTKSKFSKDLTEDIQTLKELHNDLSKYDVGQAIIMQNQRVIGIEGSEGTDNLIKRCKEYIDPKSKHPGILAKFAKQNQDLRVDLPTVGIDTLKNMLNSNLDALVIDFKNTLIVDKSNMIDFANKNNIVIYGV